MFTQLLLEEVVSLRQRSPSIQIVRTSDESYFCWLDREVELRYFRFGQRVVDPSGRLEPTDMLGQLLAALGSISSTVQVT